MVSPVKKPTRFNFGHLSVLEKQCILNMYKQILSDTPQMKITTIVKKIADTAGVAKSTVYRTMKEYRETDRCCYTSTSSGGRPHIVATYNETTKKYVRQIIHNFFHNNELPTLDKILKEVQSRSDLPQMCRSDLHCIMR
ncbi:hypothetical protein RI129_006003 [Pyrocoelia pectoralis]|uniref:Uncharacterized protein n=1 Tax=Pyrocoelia pectoralis TaxID=417401 RepID=A0AAN7VG84_9COLE